MASASGAPPSRPPTPPSPSSRDASGRRLALAETPRGADDLSPETGAEPQLPVVPRDTYAIAGKFAQGGIGRILKAHDPVLGRTVALKELLVAGRQLDEERFIREVLLTARLQHPGIVPVYAAGRWPTGEPFYAMKLVSGRSFDRVIADARALPARLALIPHVLAIAETIAYAHAQGIIHRDLKPGNVLVGEFGETVVIDWGLAKQFEAPPEADAPLTTTAPDGPPTPQPRRRRGPDEVVTRRLDPPFDRAPPSAVDTPRADQSQSAAPSAVDTPRADRSQPSALAAPPGDLSQRPAASADTPRPAAHPGSSPNRQPLSASTQLTHVGAVVGTPGFMSPEQADGAETDARTDVFALGAILYHTLSGRLPYDADGIAEMLYKTVYEAPVPLQVRDPDVPDELAAIVDKAMARSPGARYPTARAFADDLRRFQTGQIVGAHRYTPWELLVRVLRRWRTSLTIAAAALAVIVVVVILSFREVREERDKAVAAEAEAIARLDAVSFEYARQRADDDPVAAIDLLAGLSPHADWRRIRQVAAAVHARGLPRVLLGHRGAVSRAVFAPDSSRLATTSDDCTLRVWDLSSGTDRVYHGHTDEVWRAAWSPDLRRVATTSRDRTVRVWDLETGAAQVLRGHGSGVRNVAFSADGRTLYSSDDDEILRRWDLDAGTGETIDLCSANNFPWTDAVIGCMTPQAVILHDLRTGVRTRVVGDVRLNYNGAVSPDGRWIAAGALAEPVQLWDRDAGAVRPLRWPEALQATAVNNREMRFSADSRLLAVPLRAANLGVWDVATDRLDVYQPHAGYTRRTAFSPDGELIASVGGDNTVHLIDRRSASERALIGSRALLIDAQFSRDGRHLAGVGNDPRVFLWSEDSFRTRLWRLGDGPALHAEGADADLVAVASGVDIAVVDELELRPRARMTAPRPVTAIALRPDAGELYTFDAAGELHVWDPRTGARLRGGPILPPDATCELVPLPAPHPLIATCRDLIAYRVDTAAIRAAPLEHRISVATPVVTATGVRLALGGEDGRLTVWDPATDGRRHLHTYDRWVRLIAAVPGTDRALAVSERDIDTWSLTTGDRTRLPDHPLQINAAHVSADGRRALTISRDNLLRVFDLATGELVHVLAPEGNLDPNAVLSPDGTTLAGTQDGRVLLLWDLESSRPGEARRLATTAVQLHRLRFDDDGAVVGVGRDGRVLRWTDDLPRDPDGVRAWVRAHHDPQAADAVVVPGCAPPPT